MSFNIKYILPGDDKTQIISKTNQNFSQVYYAGVGLPGEKGIEGATGIIGQVGKDGITGPSGTRANSWIFQETPPGIYEPYPPGLIDYDVWVNTSPTGSTGGLNRVYRFSSTYGGGDYGYFWIDTGTNWISGNVFSVIQGASGPGGVNERNAILAGPTATFVFTDRQVTTSNANPRYSKVLMENDASLTVSLPVFSFGKTFYQTSDLPSFRWKTTDNDYGIIFSGEGEMEFQSQATGSYSSTGGTVGVTAGSNISITSSSTGGVFATGGIQFSTASLDFSSSNLSIGNRVDFNTITTGLTGSTNQVGYSFGVTGSLSNESGFRSVLNYSGGPSGGTSIKPNINLSVDDYSIFRVNNSGGGSFPTLSIGYTGGSGSTGPSGGTGANIYKSYQTVSSTATSIKYFSDLNPSNYIEVVPSNDVIRVIPSVPSGTSISANGRTNRLWIYITGISSFLEASNISEIDIFLDSTVYSIGGVALETNYTNSNGIYGEFYIFDGGTGATSGCRHVKMNFLGSVLPTDVNNTLNKFAYIQSFCSNDNRTLQVPYFYSSPPYSGSYQLTVICTELYSQGYMSDSIIEADEMYGKMILEFRPEVMIGYHFWAKPIVSLMKKSKLFTDLVWVFAGPWSKQMAYEMGASDKGSLFGKILMEIGIFGSGILGKIISWKKSTFSNYKLKSDKYG